MVLSALLTQIGPNSGAPFEDASLPFEQLKAPPDSAFEILLVSACVFLLIVLATMMFVALSKLRAIDEKLGELETHTPRRDDGATRIEAALEELAARQRSSDQVVDRDTLANLLDERALQQSAAVAKLTVEVQRSLREFGVTLAGHGRASATTQKHTSSRDDAAPNDPVAATCALVRARLESQGYTSVEIITPREEITDDVRRAGAVVVEARRSGAVCKGRVLLEDGAPVDVVLRPGHEMFP